MTFNPDNLIFVYLILALLAVALAIVIHGMLTSAGSERRHDKHRR